VREGGLFNPLLLKIPEDGAESPGHAAPLPLLGADMEQVFVAAHAAARRRGVRALIALWMRELIDLTVTGRRPRSGARRYGAEFVVEGVGRRWRRQGEG